VLEIPIYTIEMKNPTLRQKVEEYERFLHNINLMMIAGSSKGIKQLLDNADSWSYAHRIGNGTYSEKEQQEIINKAFWKLNTIDD
jgi:hypothetical protein